MSASLRASLPAPQPVDERPALRLEGVRVPAYFLGGGGGRERLRASAMSLLLAGAAVAPLAGALAALHLIGGPFTLITAAALLGGSTAVIGACHGRRALARGYAALAAGDTVGAGRSFDALIANAERVVPGVAAWAFVGRAELRWKRGELDAAAFALEQALAHLRRSDPRLQAAEPGLRWVLHAHRAQLAAVCGRRARAREALEQLEDSAAPVELYDQLRRRSRLVHAFHVGDAELCPDIAGPPDSALELILRAWQALARGDQARARELFASFDAAELGELQARFPRVVTWARSQQRRRVGYR
jgi:hypothetical protein